MMTLVRVTGSHHVFKSDGSGETLVVPHRQERLGKRLSPCHLLKVQDGNLTEIDDMAHYIALIEDAGPDRAIGVWFPDLPGCTSGGDDIDEALRNAPEALELYAESFEERRQTPAASANAD